MTKFTLKFILLVFFISSSLNAQDTIALKNGLVTGSTSKGNRSIIYTDPVFYNLITKKDYEPIETDSVGIGRQGEVERWEPLTVNEKGVFKTRKLRGGYLYVTYNSLISEIKILEISGHNEVFVNGIPRGGDVYNKHLTFHPVELLKGKNTFLVKGGRGEVFMQLLSIEKPIALLERDMTNPDFLTTENDTKTGSIRILNSTSKTLRNLRLVSEANGETLETNVSTIIPLSMRKVPYLVKDAYSKKDTVRVKIKLFEGLKLIDETSVLYHVRTPEERYTRTFISKIDGSVQYFSVKEGLIKPGDKPAMFLSLHGANVEAKNQAVQYKAKDWGHVIAPTNRRDYGFNWEDWGRWDAMEVQELAENMYGTDPNRTYLTGHSMGGHGTWHVGATFPSKWAAIVPMSGWYSLFSYANKEALENPTALENMFVRANHASHTLELSRNYLQQGVYIQHGDADDVVPVDQARFMRKHLAEFHPDFAYLEYEDKKHWFGIDFSSIFDYFKWHTIPNNDDVKTFEFRTASPGVSSESRYITLYQQEKLFEFSGVKVTQNVRNEKQIKNDVILRKRHISIETENLKKFKLDIKHTMASDTIEVMVDSVSFNNIASYKKDELWFEKENNTWVLTEKPTSSFEKNPLRYGNFKDAFKNNMVFVYGTKGTQEENQWAINKVRFDAETFYYRGNGSIDIISDKEFSLKKFKDRSVILYGNATTNAAWKLLLSESPVQVKRDEVKVGHKILKGNNYGTYLIYPRKDSKTASVAAISGTGIEGFKAMVPNKYFGSGTDIPDMMIFTPTIYQNGIESIKATGYFGNDWSLENGEIEWQDN
ncbi:prolyl oligopeptidase family serine peptidase [Mariniflexile sp. AS56]|uniref:prolyl oligopeptidase family serine peptidase n=1 Tax=Mariniflexile sp. AS56 TaxID=3063957 RepID=UPI0026EFA9E0|nr:prolyl oligopeptidase family serine peptidase [Mariniflexile sp. AS56]MDO7172632.1 prolyl oligopeptidase family serine peptidase [Mariniflexile sp. AS56]